MAEMLYQGKVKQVWSTDDPDILEFRFTNQISVFDQIIPYGASYPSSVYFDQSLDGEEGAIQNIIDWGGMNGCQDGLLPTIFEEYYDYSIMGYDDCHNGTEVKLVTLNFAAHSPYPSNSYFMDNPTDINTVQIVWEFLSQFSK